MRRVLTFLPLLLLVGCLGSGPKAPVCWIFGASDAKIAPADADALRKPARIGELSVRAPYDGLPLAVLRADGSVAFDPCNSFAARPSALLKGAAEDVLAASGAYDFQSAADPRILAFVDVTVTRLALDCKTEGCRKAVVDVVVVERQGGRIHPDKVRVAAGAGSVDAADGNYSRAFSQALADALAGALADL